MMVLSFRRHGSEHATLRATQIRGAGYEAEPERAYLVGATDTESPQAGAPTLLGLECSQPLAGQLDLRSPKAD